MKRLLLATGAILALGVGWALSQAVIQQTLSGSEAWQVGQGPAGPGFYTTTEAMRGGMNYAIVPTQTTFTQTISPNVQVVVVTGAITTLNLSFPAAPFDQQRITIACPGGVVTTLNMSVGVAQSASSISGPSNAAGGSSTVGTCSNGLATSVSATYVASVNAGGPSAGGYTWNRVQ